VSMQYRGFRDLRVYQLAYSIAKTIFDTTRHFPPEEKYSLTDQIRRSSRSVAANIAEAWRKRQYEKLFISKLVEANGEATETEVWLDMALDYGYLPIERHDALIQQCDLLERMLSSMINQPGKFCH
jgi:four helix bundle protein